MRGFSVRKVILAVIDMFIVIVSALITNYGLSILHIPDVNNMRLGVVIFMNIVLCFLALLVCGAYSKLWRHFKKTDYLSCVLGMFIGSAFSVIFQVITEHYTNIYFIVVNAIVSTLGVCLFRFMFKNAFLAVREEKNEEVGIRTLIIGAGIAGKIIIKEMEYAKSDSDNPAGCYRPICLVDDDNEKVGLSVSGIKVEGTTQDIVSLCKNRNIELIIFAIPSCDETERKRILDICSQTKLQIKTIPYISKLLADDSGLNILSQVKDIKIEDLLGRDPITFDKDDIRRLINNKVCMITGGGGSIGSELTRQIAKYKPKQVIIVDIYENNAYEIQQELVMEYGDELNLVTLIASVRDYQKMCSIFREYKPEIVFHAAAHKHVPLMETSPEEAVKNNVIGTFNVATLADYFDVKKFIMISTDKAVNPTNVMGATKRCCEMIIQYMAQSHTNTEFITTRFGNVLGSNGSVIPLFKKQIESGRPVTVTHPDIIRYFMTIPEAVSLVLQAGAMAHGGEIFVLDMGAPVKITTLAENLIRMYGMVPYKDVQIKFTGLRPGEKLFEELLMDEEGLKETDNKKIFIGNQIHIDSDLFMQRLTKLNQYAKSNDSQRVVDELCDIVPTFKHAENKRNEAKKKDAILAS